MYLQDAKDKYGDLLTDKLVGYFKPDVLGHLVNKYGSGSSSVKVTLDTGAITYNFGERASLVKTDNNVYVDQPPFIYIPPREFLKSIQLFMIWKTDI